MISNNNSWEGKPGFKAEYFINKELKGAASARTVNESLTRCYGRKVKWSTDHSVRAWYARYSAMYKADKDGEVNFEVEADDGYRFM